MQLQGPYKIDRNAFSNSMRLTSFKKNTALLWISGYYILQEQPPPEIKLTVLATNLENYDVLLSYDIFSHYTNKLKKSIFQLE